MGIPEEILWSTVSSYAGFGWREATWLGNPCAWLKLKRNSIPHQKKSDPQIPGNQRIEIMAKDPWSTIATQCPSAGFLPSCLRNSRSSKASRTASPPGHSSSGLRFESRLLQKSLTEASAYSVFFCVQTAVQGALVGRLQDLGKAAGTLTSSVPQTAHRPSAQGQGASALWERIRAALTSNEREARTGK